MLEALLELLARFVLEFVFYTVLYGIGWIMLKAITLGHYPPRRTEKHNQELVALFPVATFFCRAHACLLIGLVRHVHPPRSFPFGATPSLCHDHVD